MTANANAPSKTSLLPKAAFSAVVGRAAVRATMGPTSCRPDFPARRGLRRRLNASLRSRRRRSAAREASVHDQNVALRVARDLGAHALAEQALHEIRLARADDDHVGIVLVCQLDDGVGRLACRRDVFGVDPAVL